MSLWVAVPCALAAAAAYGSATALQHRQAHAGPPSPGQASTTIEARDAATRVDPRRLAALLIDPRWLLSVGGDVLGLVLQVIALANGPVVLIQPLLVLALPVALPVGWLLGGPRPERSDLMSCAVIVGALTWFSVLVRYPGAGHPLSSHYTAWLVIAALLAGAGVSLTVRNRSARVRAICYGTVSGTGFGVVGVLLNSAATEAHRHGVSALAHVPGAFALAGVLVVGGAAIVLTQVSFQIGDLGATFPANESAAPVVAVVLGAALLGEHVPTSAPALLAYPGCLAAIVFGTIHLARTRP